MKFKAYQNRFESGKLVGGLTELKLSDLSKGDVIIKVFYSAINYKDALGATGKGKIFRQLPIIGGIDLAGVIYKSHVSDFREGDRVLATGCDIGEIFDGGYAEFASVKKESVVLLPDNLSLKESMILGTAGLTAALCLYRIEQSGQHPDMGPVVVTGASGGVGSIAVSMLSSSGYEVIAISRKKESISYLRSLGADSVSSFSELNLKEGALEKARFAGVIDNLGGNVLSQLCAHVKPWGSVAVVGLVLNHNLSMTVMPLILRGVSLLGISSNNCPNSLRRRLWKRMATRLKPKDINKLVYKEVSLEELEGCFYDVIEGQVTGRILVKIADDIDD